MIDRYLNDKYHSPSAINNYIECPRKYFYENILKFESNSEIPDYMNYGSAVHNACEYLVKEAKDNKEYPSKENFINKFYEELEKQAISTKEQRKIFEQRGKNELDKFYHHMTDFPISKIVGAEDWLKGEYDGMKFIGKIDRIDLSGDGSYIISDYKTGEPKDSRKICIGGENENYYNQICLYKYFYEKIEKRKVAMVQFLFPMDGTKTYQLNPTEEECEVVINNFKAAIHGIENCEFEPKENETNCSRCQYKNFCQFNIV
jgi:DNA helicase-2/ATP-dependent DNA helicase PcrA